MTPKPSDVGAPVDVSVDVSEVVLVDAPVDVSVVVLVGASVDVPVVAGSLAPVLAVASLVPVAALVSAVS